MKIWETGKDFITYLLTLREGNKGATGKYDVLKSWIGKEGILT